MVNWLIASEEYKGDREFDRLKNAVDMASDLDDEIDAYNKAREYIGTIKGKRERGRLQIIIDRARKQWDEIYGYE